MTRNHPQLFRAAGAACVALLLVAASWLAPPARSAGGAAAAPQAAESFFIRKLALKGNDIVHSPSTGQLYASVPSGAGAAGNSIAAIDPATGAVNSAVFIGSEPNRLALSDDGHTLYASLDGAFAIRRFDVATQTPGAQFAVGGDSFHGPLIVNDMAVSPGEPHVVAVARYYRGSSPPEAGVAVFDNGVRRTKTGPGHSDGADFLAYSASASKLYGGGYSYGMRTMTIDAQGVTVDPSYTAFAVGARIKFDSGLVYSSTGQVINPTAKTLLGTFSGANTQAFVPDAANGRAYYLVRDNFGTGPLVLKAFDVNTFLLVGSQTLTGVAGTPTTMVRWGVNGLAFRTDAGDLHVVQTTLIPSAAAVPTPTPTPAPTPAPTATPLAAFVRQLPLEANDLVYHPATQRLYASVPSTAGTGGNSVMPIDPVAGAAGAPVFVGSEPSKLALADDGQTMYVGLNGAGAVRRFDLATQTAGAQFHIGLDHFNGPSNASDIAVMPGAPGTVAVSRSGNNVSIFDDGVARAQPANVSGFVEFGAAATRVYVGSGNIHKFSAGAAGLTPDGVVYSGGFGSFHFDRDTGLLFSTSGQVIDPEAGVVRGTFTGLGFSAASLAVDSAAGRVYFLIGNPGGSGWIIRSYDINTFRPVAFINAGVIAGGTPTGLVRWGTNGLAFRIGTGLVGGGAYVYLIETALVSEAEPIPAPTPTPSPTPTPTPAYVPTFVRSINLPANDLVYNQATASLYASVPSTAGAGGNSITPIDPATGAAGAAVFVGSEPSKLALADDGRTLYVNLEGAQAVRRYDLQTQTPGIQFSVGAQRPADMEVMPGSPQTLAVSRGVGSSVAVFDDGVQRPNTSSGGAYAVLPIEFGATPSVLYGYDSYSSGFELVKFNVSAGGVSGVSMTYNLISGYSSDIEFAGGRLYASSGRVVDPEAKTVLGTFTNGSGTAFAVDQALGRVFFLTGDSFSGSNKVLRAYDINTFLPLGSVTLPGVTGTPTSLVRWGANGLAFRTANGFSSTNESRVYIIQSRLVSADAPVPTGLQLNSATASVTEAVTNVPVTVTRSGDVSAAATVEYTTGGGTATAGQDYTATSGTLTFAPGELSKNISVPILNDNLYEGNETFGLTLSNPSGAVFAGPSAVTVTIFDSESRPYVSSQGAQTVEGNSGTTDLSFAVVLSNPSVETVSVNYATGDETAAAGSDYVATSGTLTFAPGSTSATVKVPVRGDTVVEPNETFRLSFSAPVNSNLLTTSAVGQIMNDDGPGAFRFGAKSYVVSEGDGSAAVTVERVGGVSGAVSVNYSTGGGTATAGEDYTAASGTLAFGDGETSKTFNVPVTDDSKDEADETVLLTLSAPTGGATLSTQSTAELTIKGRESNPTVQFASANYSAAEGAGKVSVGVTRTGGDLSAAVSVNYATGDGNARDTSDYNLTLGTLTFAAGETEKTIDVLITNDVSVEAPETFSVGLSAPTGTAALGTPSTTTVTINSDDAAPAPNPAGDGFNAEFFVRQHYHDFFSREPDAAGLGFWTNQITECESLPEAARAACREARRVNVSAAFFLSIEFQGTGYFVYRVHQAAFNSGENLRLRTFAADAQEVGRGVTVGSGNWQQLLEANKQAFVNRFAARPEFVSAYQGMSNAQFVDALNANTLDPLAPGLGGVLLSPGERDQLVDDLNASRRTRAGVLFFVAEHQEFQRRRVNPSFVLMQYFGYLRRNPNETPDVNFDGYNFWLSKLNNHAGNFVSAEMVKAFITSGEYRARFGP